MSANMAAMSSSTQSFNLNHVESQETVTSPQTSPKTRTSCGCGIFALVFGIGIGILLGYFIVCDQLKDEVAEGVFLPGVPKALIQDAKEGISETLQYNIKGSNIKTYLRELADTPRVAGTQNTADKAEYLFDFWTKHGADNVQKFPYDILLSYPNKTDPSKVYIIDNGTTTFESQGPEHDTTKWGDRSDLMSPILGYTPDGDVQGELVYANYAREEDFAVLEANHVPVRDRIVICRYGKLFRGDKVKFAEDRHARGIVIYDDPADWNPTSDGDYYPASAALPPDGVQRGSAFTNDGDPQTPGYAAKDYAYRHPVDNKKLPLPKIVAVPISYKDAVSLLRGMSGDEVPDEWRGWLDVTYKFGPGLTDTNYKVRVKSTNFRETRPINNVCATITGNVEKDRYVIMGAHLDSWVYGGVDNAAGVATMMEVSRAILRATRIDSWRPRRSIIFCAWDAEEYGLIGSTEFVEEFGNNLRHRTVALINSDSPVTGNFLPEAMGSPQLYKVMYDSAKAVANPLVDERNRKAEDMLTLYASMLKHRPLKHHKTGKDLELPTIAKPSGGSDFVPFVTMLGVPVAEVMYVHGKADMAFYSNYHTVYDTVDLIEKFYDPAFELHAGIAKFDAEMLRQLADSLVLPLDVRDFAWQLRVYYDKLDSHFGKVMRNHSVPLEHIDSAITDFASASDKLMVAVKTMNKNNPVEVREFNDQLMLFERSFIDPFGLPSRPYTKHIAYSPSSKNSYGGGGFPGLIDGMYEIGENKDRWEAIKEHTAAVVHAIRSATSALGNAMSPSGAM